MIYISSSTLNGDSIDARIDQLHKIGVRNIELSGGVKYCANIVHKIKKYQKEFSSNFLIHNYFPPPEDDFVLNIASCDEIIRRRSVEFIKERIAIASELGGNLYSVHAGYARKLLPPRGRSDSHFIAEETSIIDVPRAEQNMYQSLEEILPYLRQYEVTLGVENLFPIKTMSQVSLLCEPEKIFQFLNCFAGNDNIGLLLDLGHLSIAANHFGFNKDEFVKILSENHHHKIVGIHLSENDGVIDNHTVLCEDSWQLPVVKAYASERIPLTVECRGLKPEEVLQQLDVVRNSLKGGT